MRITKEQAEANRRTILDAAERLFRERGIAGIGVADLMKAAGFSHGGFYNHFESKDALVAAACDDAITRANDALIEELKTGKLSDYTREYLSPEHRDDPGTGCTLGALAGDAAYCDRTVQKPFATGIATVIEAFSAYLAKLEPKQRATARPRAIALFSELVGALVLARAISDADPKLSDEILSTNRSAIAKAID